MAENLASLKEFSYQKYFVGEPILSISEQNVYIQKVNPIPMALIRFSHRKYLPCPDGFYREPTRAVQEHLIKLNIIDKKSDCCTNIPWKFFKKHYTVVSKDCRVKRIIEHCKSHGIKRKELNRLFKNWDEKGGSDILSFGKQLIAIEVKYIGDRFSVSQLKFKKILKILQIPYFEFRFELVEQSSFKKLSNNSFVKAKKKEMFSSFISSDTGQKFQRHIDYHWTFNESTMNPTDIYKNRIYYFSRNPSSFVTMLYNTVRFEKNNTTIYFTEQEIIDASVSVYLSGYMKWWLIPILLLPFIKKDKIDYKFIKLLKCAYDWENKFRTIHFTSPVGTYDFLKKPGYRTLPEKIIFKQYTIIDLYKKFKKSKNVDIVDVRQKIKELLLKFKVLKKLEINSY